MIRVNLLAAASGPAAAPARQWFPKEQRSAAMGLALLVASGLGVGGYWWYLSSERASVERQITEGEDELVRLKQAADLVAKANARKAELTERLNLIERLRSAKRAPVTLLETVSSSMPEGMWLLELKQSGASVQIDGRAMSLTAVTDFAERMQTSGLFKKPVEILTTTTEVVEETGVVRFSVRAEAVPPTTTTTTVNATAPAGQPGV
ncbi:MAG TPA: PilN domain-containing protein [Vicinamibacterales bacterium]|jgi:type IV pilus assembly protein PilN|nr:PilN domain-containing protein [Vicinamibacterales bacterium]